MSLRPSWTSSIQAYLPPRVCPKIKSQTFAIQEAEKIINQLGVFSSRTLAFPSRGSGRVRTCPQTTGLVSRHHWECGVAVNLARQPIQLSHSRPRTQTSSGETSRRENNAAVFLPLFPYTLNKNRVNSSFRTNGLLAATGPGANGPTRTAPGGKGSGPVTLLQSGKCAWSLQPSSVSPLCLHSLRIKGTSSSLPEEVMGFPTNKTASVHQSCAAGSLKRQEAEDGPSGSCCTVGLFSMEKLGTGAHCPVGRTL